MFAAIPVHTMLRMFGFSTEFGERMVYPLVALFFGTGNQTPYISSAILVRARDTRTRPLPLTYCFIRNASLWIQA